MQEKVELPSKYSRERKLAEIKREIAMRQGVYPTSVRIGRMTKAEAELRIDIMKEIAKDYGGTG